MLAAALCLVAVRASALEQGEHRDLSLSACWKQKLPSQFCAEVGAAAYNVDHYEWNDLAAHGQPEAGEDKCQAANKAVARVRSIALELRSIAAKQTDYDPALAVALGRVLHTLQDNCAHAGMPNPEHAWFSLSDSCADTESSPDVQPEAVACAEQQTALAFATFTQVISVPTPPPPQGEGNPQSQPAQFWPKRGDVCDFLKSAPTWDGVDRRWNNSRVVPALQDQLHATLVVSSTAPALDVCAGGAQALEPSIPVPNIDTGSPPKWCTLLEIYCAGKTDGSDVAPPWEKSAEAGSAPENESGCQLRRPGGPGSGFPLMLGAVLAATAVRRRRCRPL